MQRLPRIRMTCGTVGRTRITRGGTGKSTVSGVMTARTTIMRICCAAYQCIIMAVTRTATRRCYNNTRMTRITCMHALPRSCMTRCTVTAANKVLLIRVVRRHQAAVTVMTAGTGIMRLRCTAYQCIIMTA